MKGCLVALGIVAGLMVTATGVFRLNFYDVHVRYRLTVEVQDGDQIKTGSSVVEASYNIEPTWSWSGRNPHVRTVGFEPTVDLAEKGMLFLSFSNATRTPAEIVERNQHVFCAADDMYCLPFEAYGKAGTSIPAHNYDREVPLQMLLRQGGPREVSFANLPELVRFRDIEDWRTRTRVSPHELAASFGPGVELKRVILQLTSDPITPMPEVWPQWLKQQRGGV
jgi:hypothetical protein